MEGGGGNATFKIYSMEDPGIQFFGLIPAKGSRVYQPSTIELTIMCPSLTILLSTQISYKVTTSAISQDGTNVLNDGLHSAGYL